MQKNMVNLTVEGFITFVTDRQSWKGVMLKIPPSQGHSKNNKTLNEGYVAPISPTPGPTDIKQ